MIAENRSAKMSSMPSNREPSIVVGIGEVGITGYQPNIDACYKKLKTRTFENNSNRFRTNLDPFICVVRLPSENNNES